MAPKRKVPTTTTMETVREDDNPAPRKRQLQPELKRYEDSLEFLRTKQTRVSQLSVPDNRRQHKEENLKKIHADIQQTEHHIRRLRGLMGDSSVPSDDDDDDDNDQYLSVSQLKRLTKKLSDAPCVLRYTGSDLDKPSKVITNWKQDEEQLQWMADAFPDEHDDRHEWWTARYRLATATTTTTGDKTRDEKLDFLSTRLRQIVSSPPLGIFTRAVDYQTPDMYLSAVLARMPRTDAALFHVVSVRYRAGEGIGGSNPWKDQSDKIRRADLVVRFFASSYESYARTASVDWDESESKLMQFTHSLGVTLPSFPSTDRDIAEAERLLRPLFPETYATRLVKATSTLNDFNQLVVKYMNSYSNLPLQQRFLRRLLPDAPETEWLAIDRACESFARRFLSAQKDAAAVKSVKETRKEIDKLLVEIKQVEAQKTGKLKDKKLVELTGKHAVLTKKLTALVSSSPSSSTENWALLYHRAMVAWASDMKPNAARNRQWRRIATAADDDTKARMTAEQPALTARRKTLELAVSRLEEDAATNNETDYASALRMLVSVARHRIDLSIDRSTATAEQLQTILMRLRASRERASPREQMTMDEQMEWLQSLLQAPSLAVRFVESRGDTDPDINRFLFLLEQELCPTRNRRYENKSDWIYQRMGLTIALVGNDRMGVADVSAEVRRQLSENSAIRLHCDNVQTIRRQLHAMRHSSTIPSDRLTLSIPFVDVHRLTSGLCRTITQLLFAAGPLSVYRSHALTLVDRIQEHELARIRVYRVLTKSNWPLPVGTRTASVPVDRSRGPLNSRLLRRVDRLHPVLLNHPLPPDILDCLLCEMTRVGILVRYDGTSPLLVSSDGPLSGNVNVDEQGWGLNHVTLWKIASRVYGSVDLTESEVERRIHQACDEKLLDMLAEPTSDLDSERFKRLACSRPVVSAAQKSSEADVRYIRTLQQQIADAKKIGEYYERTHDYVSFQRKAVDDSYLKQTLDAYNSDVKAYSVYYSHTQTNAHLRDRMTNVPIPSSELASRHLWHKGSVETDDERRAQLAAASTAATSKRRTDAELHYAALGGRGTGLDASVSWTE